jgi:signal transduction histidine kinase
MAKVRSPRINVDQMICGLRWLPLLLAPTLAYLNDLPRQEIDPTLLLGLTFGGLAYNLIATLMVYVKFFPNEAAYVFLALDVVLSIGFLLATDFSLYPLLTIGLFTTLEAAARFNVMAGMGTAIVLALPTGLRTILSQGYFSPDTWLPLALSLVALLLTAGGTGVLVDRISKEVAHARDEELRTLRRTNERAKAIYQMASALNATLDYQQAMKSILDISLMGLEELEWSEQKPVAMLLLYGPGGMYVATARHLRREDEGRTIPGEGGIIAKALSTGEATLVRNLYQDEELSQFASLRACRSAILVPLRVGFDIYGIVVVASTVADAFMDEHKELVAAVCTQAVMALQNAQLYQDLREERDKIIDQQEEARAQLARDLHDGPTQSISAIAMRLNYVMSLLHRNPARIKKELDDLEMLARRTTREIRTMLFALRPQMLETQGLAAAVKHYADRVGEDADFQIHLELMDLADTLDINTQTVAFNIVEEAMNNVKKHAECQNAWIRLGLKDDLFIAQVKDDGKGFDVQATLGSYDQRGSLGLLNLRERAQLVEGKTEIVSTPGQGTTITLIIPLVK